MISLRYMMEEDLVKIQNLSRLNNVSKGGNLYHDEFDCIDFQKAQILPQYLLVIEYHNNFIGYIYLSGVNESIPDLERASYDITQDKTEFTPYIYIKQIAIDENNRGKGYGTIAIKLLTGLAKNINLFSTILSTNTASLRSHGENGFIKVGRLNLPTDNPHYESVFNIYYSNFRKRIINSEG